MSNPSRPNVFAHPPFDAVADFRRYVILTDHFVGGNATSGTVGDLGWSVTSVAGDSVPDVDLVGTAATVQGHPGVIQLNTGATTPAAADEGALSLPNVDGIVLYDPSDGGAVDDEHVYVAAIVRFASVADIEFNFGLFDAAGVAGRGVNSISAEFDASADANWQLVVVDGSTATAADTGIAVAVDTWYVLEIGANEDEVQLFIDGVLVASTASANIPDDEGLGPVFKVATEAAAEASVLIDAFQMRVPVANTGL